MGEGKGRKGRGDGEEEGKDGRRGKREGFITGRWKDFEELFPSSKILKNKFHHLWRKQKLMSP